MILKYKSAPKPQKIEKSKQNDHLPGNHKTHTFFNYTSLLLFSCFILFLFVLVF